MKGLAETELDDEWSQARQVLVPLKMPNVRNNLARHVRTYSTRNLLDWKTYLRLLLLHNKKGFVVTQEHNLQCYLKMKEIRAFYVNTCTLRTTLHTNAGRYWGTTVAQEHVALIRTGCITMHQRLWFTSHTRDTNADAPWTEHPTQFYSLQTPEDKLTQKLMTQKTDSSLLEMQKQSSHLFHQRQKRVHA